MASDSSQSRWSRSANMQLFRSCELHFFRRFLNVQSTFLVLGLLPPPAAGAHLFGRQHRAAAGCAADRAIALIVQTVVRHAMQAQVVPDGCFRPGRQRVEFLEAVRRVELALGELCAAGRVLAALAGDPGALAGERASERLDLADLAATLAQLDAAVERVTAVLRDVLVEAFLLGVQDLNIDAVLLADVTDQI